MIIEILLLVSILFNLILAIACYQAAKDESEFYDGVRETFNIPCNHSFNVYWQVKSIVCKCSVYRIDATLTPLKKKDNEG
jgi:hypothetical protein